MRKNLIAAVVALTLGGGATAAFLATNAVAQAPDPRDPMLLAQNTPPAPTGPNGGPARRGPAPRTAPNRPQPTAAERTARRGEMCQDMVARAAGRFAELEVRLNLTAAQQPAFSRWRDARLAAAKSRAAECAARPLPPMPAQGGPRGGRGANAMPPSPVERLTREETMLQRRLADIQAERPALEAFYNSLTPAQRLILGRRGLGGRRGGFGGGFGGPRGNMMFRRGAMDPGMIVGPGMMGRGPMRGGQRPGNQPPPPPAQ